MIDVLGQQMLSTDGIIAVYLICGRLNIFIFFIGTFKT